MRRLLIVDRLIQEQPISQYTIATPLLPVLVVTDVDRRVASALSVREVSVGDVNSTPTLMDRALASKDNKDSVKEDLPMTSLLIKMI